MSQMFLSPIVIRAFRTIDGLESFDTNEPVEWFVLNKETGERLHGPYTTYDDAVPMWRVARQ